MRRRNPRCPDCGTVLEPRIASPDNPKARYVRRWECPNPRCLLLHRKTDKHGRTVELKRATAL